MKIGKVSMAIILARNMIRAKDTKDGGADVDGQSA